VCLQPMFILKHSHSGFLKAICRLTFAERTRRLPPVSFGALLGGAPLSAALVKMDALPKFEHGIGLHCPTSLEL